MSREVRAPSEDVRADPRLRPGPIRRLLGESALAPSLIDEIPEPTTGRVSGHYFGR